MTPADERSPASGVDDVVKLALAVPGVVAVRVEPAGQDGASMVRLELAEGVEAPVVAAAMEEAIAARPPTPRRSVEDVVEAPPSGPAATQAPATAPSSASPDPAAPTNAAPISAAPSRGVDVLFGSAAASRNSSRPRTGRISVPAVTSPTIAATPAPAWLGEGVEAAASPAAPSAASVLAPQPAGVPLANAAATSSAATSEGRYEAPRWCLDRLDVGTDRLTSRASVTLTHADAVHTGIAEAPATPSGTARAVAAATVRAVESAAGGRLRADVDAVSVTDVAGRRAALVILDLALHGGPEQLLGAALVDRDEHRGIARAVLDAANRRLFRHR